MVPLVSSCEMEWNHPRSQQEIMSVFDLDPCYLVRIFDLRVDPFYFVSTKTVAVEVKVAKLKANRNLNKMIKYNELQK